MTHKSNGAYDRIMRVGIDARLLYQTGVGVYIRNLLLRIARTKNLDIEIHVFSRSRDIVALKDILPDQCLTRIVFHITEVPWHGVREQLVFLIQILRASLDLMHFPYFSWPVLYWRPFVATVHDTILLTNATGKASTKGLLTYWIRQFIFRLVLSQQLRRARRIIVPSMTVAGELAKFTHVTRDKVEVLYEGLDDGFRTATPAPVARLEGTDYFLYVGNCYPHKNVETLLDAFKRVVDKHPHTYLCIVGPRNTFSERIRSRVYQQSLQRTVLFYHDVPVSEVKWMYTFAKAFVFPSKAEGFGLPVVEAAACRCPLILSDIPVFREIIGDQARYFDLYDDRSLARHMEHALSTSQRQEYVLDPRYSFDLMGDEILKIYHQILTRSV